MSFGQRDPRHFLALWRSRRPRSRAGRRSARRAAWSSRRDWSRRPIGRTPSSNSVHTGSSVCLVDHRHQPSGNRSGDDVRAVWRDVDVVDAALGRNALHLLERRGVDHVDGAGRRHDADVDAAAVAADRDVVGPAGQRDLLGHLQRLAVDDVQRLLRLAAEVEAAAVGRRGGAVIDRHARDLADDRVASPDRSGGCCRRAELVCRMRTCADSTEAETVSANARVQARRMRAVGVMADSP